VVSEKRIIRVFPRRTSATPTDELAYVGLPDLWVEADLVQISVAFGWDLPQAEGLAREWRRIAPVEMGGPALGDMDGEFVPGRFLRPGYTITSRGCPNHCWFCQVWRNVKKLHELPIRDGWIVQDDNLLACSRPHVEAVFAMLARQNKRAEFRGGLEALWLEDWHVERLAALTPEPVIWFAYDHPVDLEPLCEAVRKLRRAGFHFGAHRIRCYVLVGWPDDSFEDAEKRLNRCLKMGITPMAMLYRGEHNSNPVAAWRRFARQWARPRIIHAQK